MAWLSIGTSNADLCNKLQENDVLRDGPILSAFQSTDRGDFIPAEDRSQAYHDRPYKRGHVHISAPHMYSTVLNALELSEGLSFLNIGSGSGYLSCLAAFILGKGGLVHGLELYDDMVLNCRRSVDAWLTKLPEEKRAVIHHDTFSFVQGNCFQLDFGARQGHYDRIYIGAGCPEDKVELFYHLLSDGGILVAPINEKNVMIKVKRVCGQVFQVVHVSNVHFAPLVESSVALSPKRKSSKHLHDGLDNDAVQAICQADAKTLQIVRALHISHRRRQDNARSHVALPSLIWAPNAHRHKQFPRCFRDMVMLLLLAANRTSAVSPASSHKHKQRKLSRSYSDFSNTHVVSTRSNLASWLPVTVWHVILSYCARDWFVVGRSPLENAQIELLAERKMRKSAEEQLHAMKAAKHKLERERDLLRMMLMRMGVNHQSAVNLDAVQGDEDDVDMEAHSDSDDEEDESEESSQSSEEEEVEDQSDVDEEAENAVPAVTVLQDIFGAVNDGRMDGAEDEEDDGSDGEDGTFMDAQDGSASPPTLEPLHSESTAMDASLMMQDGHGSLHAASLEDSLVSVSYATTHEGSSAASSVMDLSLSHSQDFGTGHLAVRARNMERYLTSHGIKPSAATPGTGNGSAAVRRDSESSTHTDAEPDADAEDADSMMLFAGDDL